MSIVPIVAFVGIAGATFTSLVLTQRIFLRTLPPVIPFPRPVPSVDPDLQDWEVAAAAFGDVDPDYDDEVDPEPPDPSLIIGTGSPADLCGVVVRNPPPEEVLCVLDPLEDPRFAPRASKAAFAKLGKSSIWPVDTKHKLRLVTSYWTADGIRGSWGREFGTKRTSKDGTPRRHAGIDLYGNVGDPVLAPESGRILAILPFKNPTWAVYIRTPDDQVINLGEVLKFSWRDFKVKPGDAVKKGDPVARIGQMGSKHMLHFETYDATGVSDDEMVDVIRKGQMRWTDADNPPTRLRDPSRYLVDAATRTYRSEEPKV
jgi:hypothetical protein